MTLYLSIALIAAFVLVVFALACCRLAGDADDFAAVRGPYPHPQQDQRESDYGSDWLGIGGGADFVIHNQDQ